MHLTDTDIETGKQRELAKAAQLKNVIGNARKLNNIIHDVFTRVTTAITDEQFKLLTYGEEVIVSIYDPALTQAIDSWNDVGHAIMDSMLRNLGYSFGLELSMFPERSFVAHFLPSIEYFVSVKLQIDSDYRDYDEDKEKQKPLAIVEEVIAVKALARAA